MSKLHVEQEPFTAYPAGDYTVQLMGFKPKLSKDKKSINLRPTLRIVGHQDLNDKPVFYNANTGFFPGLIDLVHAFGIHMDNEGENEGDLPGDFPGFNSSDISTIERCTYAGPLLGKSGRLEIVEVQAQDKDGKPKPNQMRNDVKRFHCQVPGCQIKHRDTLLRA